MFSLAKEYTVTLMHIACMHKRISQQVHNLTYQQTKTQNTAQKERHFQEMKPAKTLHACNLPGKSHSEMKQDPFAGILMSMCKK